MIFLIGARASGKTTIGQLLAEKLGWRFVDLDAVLLKELGESIEKFVQKNGWPAFRQKESACLKMVCEGESGRLVLATGGGVPLAEKNRQLMRSLGQVVWLDTATGEMIKRLADNPMQEQRPALTAKPLSEEVEAVCRERAGVYRECCHFAVDGALSPDQVCNKIMEGLNISLSIEE